MSKIRVLAWGDYACSTGFGTVMKNIMSEINNTGNYEIDVIGVNYDGAPLRYKHLARNALASYQCSENSRTVR